MIRRFAFLSVGGFTPRLFIGGEEELLAADLAARGHWICYVSEVTVHHHPSPRRDTNSRRWTVIRNGLWFAWLRRPLASAVPRTLWQARSAPRDGTALHGFASAVAGLPWVLSRRSVLPGQVERGLRLLAPPEMTSPPPGRRHAHPR